MANENKDKDRTRDKRMAAHLLMLIRYSRDVTAATEARRVQSHLGGCVHGMRHLTINMNKIVVQLPAN